MRLPSEIVLALALGALPAAAPQRCPHGVEADLGFSNMTFTQGHTYLRAGYTQFGTEPILGGIDPNGPAAGRLREGDALVAVNGELITTRAGSLRYAALRPGVPVRLTVRRAGRNLDVTLEPRARCAVALPAPPAPPAPPRSPALPATPSADVEAPLPPDVPLPPLPPVPLPGKRATLGLSFSCHCALQLNGEDEVWSFKEAPEVTQVTAGGPAARAGLRRGDHIESIDGFGILSTEGGRRFGAIAPGQHVRLGVRRGDSRLELVVVPGRND